MSNALVQGKSTTNLNPSGEGYTEDINATAGALHVYVASLLAGESQQFDAIRTMNAASEYELVAASQTNQTLGATGGSGDYLERLLCVVATPATAQVQLKDGSGTAFTVFPNSPGGGIGTYVLDIGLQSTVGAWQVTTGAGVSVIAVGNFA